MKLRYLLVFFAIIFAIAVFAHTQRYAIQIGDVLEVFNYGYPDLTQNTHVGPDGMVELRLIGAIESVNLTPEALAEKIEAAYKRYAQESKVTVIVKERKPQWVYAMGELREPQTINLLMEKEMTLLQLLSLCSGPTPDADLSGVILMRNGESKILDISTVFNNQGIENNISLQPSDMIIIPKLYEKRVYLFGNTEHTGPIYFEDKEPMTLNYFLSKMSFNADTMDSNIEIHRSGQQLTFDALYILNHQEQIELQTNDIIIVEKSKTRFCYVTGKEESGRIEFEKEEPMTLRTLMGKLGVDMGYLTDLKIMHADGTMDVFDSKRLETFDFELQNGDIVQFPISKRLYVIGNVPEKGEVIFSDHEVLTLRTLLIKIGYQMEQSVEIEILTPEGKSEVISTENILKRDVYLQAGSVCKFPDQRYVTVVGDLINEVNDDIEEKTPQSDRFLFRYDEPMTLKTVIQRLNAIPVETGISVTILRGLEQYQYDTKEVFYSDEQIELENADILVFEKDRDRYILLFREENKLSKIYFNANEQMDLFNLFLKLGTISEIWNDEVRVILPNGDVKITDIDAVISRETNMILEPKSMVMLPETYRSVYCFGNAEIQGEILFERTEPFTLRQLIVKANANMTQETQEIIIKSSEGITRYEPQALMDIAMDFPLEPDAIVLFKPFIPKRVSVFGEVKDPGVKVFEQNEPLNLMMLLTKAQGFQENADRNITIIKSSGEKQVINYNQLLNPSDVKLSDGAYVIVDENLEQYVLLLGDVKNPGVNYMKQDEISLLQLLSQAGGVLDWDRNTVIEVTRRDGQKEIINTDKQPVDLSQITVKVGDIVYVVPSDRLKVYVFGEVNIPKILPYSEGLTLFEAILQCGGPKDSAYLTKILYYKGGIDNYPQVVDLSHIKWSKPTTPIYLEPSDVIYVPKSALVDILRVTGFVGSMITFSSDALDIYNTMTQSNVKLPTDND